MKAVMISIKPEWVEKILNGEKTIEIRKTIPKCELPCKVYIYCTKDPKNTIAPFCFADGWHYKIYNDKTSYANGCIANIGEDVNGKVVGEFTLNYWVKFRLYPENKIVQWREESDWTRFFEKDSERRSIKAGCVPYKQLKQYLNNKDGYALYIDDLKIYDQPKELSEFKLTKAPQSWCYVEELEAK